MKDVIATLNFPMVREILTAILLLGVFIPSVAWSQDPDDVDVPDYTEELQEQADKAPKGPQNAPFKSKLEESKIPKLL